MFHKPTIWKVSVNGRYVGMVQTDEEERARQIAKESFDIKGTDQVTLVKRASIEDQYPTK